MLSPIEPAGPGRSCFHLIRVQMKTKTVFFSPKKTNSIVGITDAIQRVMDSQWFVLGKEVSAFEAEFANYLGVEHCASVGNGTDALELALRAVDVFAGDVVALAANAGFYASTAVRAVGAHPVFIDVEQDTMGMSPVHLEQVLRLNKAKAIVVTHLYGQMCNVSQLTRIAGLQNIPLIEDCAQAHGASLGGKRAGAFGTLGCFSFYPTKNLGALGDGGAVVSERADLIERVRQLRQYGWGAKYRVDLPSGRNSRLDEMQAAVLRVKLPHLNKWNEERREIALRYNNALSDLPIQCPSVAGEDYVAHLYVIRTAERDGLRAYLLRQNLCAEVHYPIPDYAQPVYRELGVKHALPQTDSACSNVLSLPCYPGFPEWQLDATIASVRAFYNGSSK